MSTLPFDQIDVFSSEPFAGNPVAVIHDADALTTEQMAAIARWTNLSETTFILAPRDPDCDYRLRIFTPAEELPFAGHPTLGSCHAWLAAGGVPRDPSYCVQECGLGQIRIRRHEERLWFAAPALRRSGSLDTSLREALCAALGLTTAKVVADQWVDNGPGWCALLLESAEAVLAVSPDFAALKGQPLGLVGPHPPGSETQFEVRAFVPGLGVPEDPVTGSLNAGIAQWLISCGRASDSFVAGQGTVLGRDGRVHIDARDGTTWVGGDAHTLISGTISV